VADAPAPVDAPAAPVVFAVAEAAPAPVEPAAPTPEVRLQYAQAAEALIAPEAAIGEREDSEPQVRSAIETVPVPAYVPARTMKPGFAPKPRRNGTGRYVVQIGAYSSSAQVDKAWSQALRRYGFNGSAEPLSTTVRIPGKGVLHRLSVASFNSQPSAARMCQSIKARGGACFVRATAGDAPLRWASQAGRSPGRA
jgi:hypothetical protein